MLHAWFVTKLENIFSSIYPFQHKSYLICVTLVFTIPCFSLLFHRCVVSAVGSSSQFYPLVLRKETKNNDKNDTKMDFGRWKPTQIIGGTASCYNKRCIVPLIFANYDEEVDDFREAGYVSH